MSTVELKKSIIDYLSYIDDPSFLTRIKEVLASKVNGVEVYYLSEFQKERVYKAEDELASGLTLSNDDLVKEIDQWLADK